MFAGLPDPLEATRYHSLVVDRDGLPDVPRGHRRDRRRHVMGLRHRELPVEGVQFHPESILTVGGHDLLRNFLAQAAPVALTRPASVVVGVRRRRGRVVVVGVVVVVVGRGRWSSWSGAGPCRRVIVTVEPLGDRRARAGRLVDDLAGLRRAERHVDRLTTCDLSSASCSASRASASVSADDVRHRRPASAPLETTSVTVGALVDRRARRPGRCG